MYKESIRKWTFGTRGGSGDPENYVDWESREPEKNLRYSNQLGSMLTYLYMVDLDSGSALMDLYKYSYIESYLIFFKLK